MTTLSLSAASKSRSEAGLAEILQQNCNLAIWEREPIENIDRLLTSVASDVRITVRLDDLSEELPLALENAGFPDLLIRDEMVADIRQLADRYCRILNLEELQVRLEIVTTDSCRKWHSDYVTARLISTYVGSGTQWLDAEDADRVKQGSEPQHINAMRPGDVGLFKGKMATEAPAIHRSPPIAGSGEKRLLLVLNPPEKT